MFLLNVAFQWTGHDLHLLALRMTPGLVRYFGCLMPVSNMYQQRTVIKYPCSWNSLVFECSIGLMDGGNDFLKMQVQCQVGGNTFQDKCKVLQEVAYSLNHHPVDGGISLVNNNKKNQELTVTQVISFFIDKFRLKLTREEKTIRPSIMT